MAVKTESALTLSRTKKRAGDQPGAFLAVEVVREPQAAFGMSCCANSWSTFFSGLLPVKARIST